MGHLDIVKLLLAKAQRKQANEPRVDYIYPLHIAARAGHVEVVRVLLDHEAKAVCVTVGQNTPLHWAAAFNHVAVISLLLERGAELEARNNNHLTPLLVAAMEGHCDALMILIEGGSSLEFLDKNDQSAIFLAAQEHHPIALALLLDTQFGPRMVDRSNRYGNRPIHVAAMNGFSSIVRSPFQGPLGSLVKTSVMMIGEMDYNTIFNENTLVLHRGATYPLFVGFLILMSIIVMNLLVGLAVDDIKSVQEQAQLKRLAMTVDLVLSVEGILPAFLRRKCIVRSKTIWPNRPSQSFSLLRRLWTFDKNAFTSSFAKPDLNTSHKSLQDLNSQLCDLRAKTDLITSLLTALCEKEGLPLECSQEYE